MRCEVCGRKIHNDPIRAVIEGAKLTVCVECSKHGKIILHEEELERKTATTPKRPQAPVSMLQRKKTLVAKVEITQEIVEGYDSKIRAAREKLGLSHEELGLRINEKASVLKHIETGKMPPNNLLASKLERTLKITLMVPISEEKVTPEISKPADREFTLGDLIELNKKGEEEPKNESNHSSATIKP